MSRSAFVEVNITNPTRLAQDSQDTADKAVKGVTDLNDPNLMSVIEKQNNIVQFAGLTSQLNVLVQNAKDDGIDTAAVTTAYNNLNTFMADILADPNHASDIDRTRYKKYQDAYNEELAKLQNALQNNTNDKFTSAASALSQAASTANVAKSAADSTYAYANSEIAVQSNATAKAQSTADGAFSQAQVVSSQAGSAIAVQSTAIAKAQSAADNAFSQAQAVGSQASVEISKNSMVTAKAQSAADNAFNKAQEVGNQASSEIAVQSEATAKAQNTADNAFSEAQSIGSQASSEIAVQSNATAKAQSTADGAFSQAVTAIDTGKATSQAVTALKDGSTLTIAQLGNGLASKVSNSEYASYKEQTASQIGQMVTNGAFSAYQQTTADLISTKVATKDFSAYQATTAKSIDSKVESSDFNTYKTQTANLISEKVSNSEYASNKEQTASQIADRVSNSAFSTYQEQTASQFASKVDNGDFTTYKTQTADLISSKVATKDFSAYQDTTAKAISSKVESNDFNTYKTQTANLINDKVSSAKYTSDKTQTDKDIASKVSSDDFSTYKTQTNELIGSKVSNGDFSTYKEQTARLIGSKVDNGDFTTYKAQTAKDISSKVSSGDFNTYKTQTDKAILSKVSNIDFDNLKISNRNLALGTATAFKMTGQNKVNQSQNAYQFSRVIPKGTLITVTFDIASSTGVGTYTMQFSGQDTGSSWQYISTGSLVKGTNHISVPLTTDSDHLHFFARLDNATGDITVSNLIVSESSKEVDWTPAPEDQATQSQITQLSGEIEQKVNSGDFSTYKSQTANLIAEKVANSDFTTYQKQTADLISAKVATKDFTAYQDTTAKSIDSMVKSKDFESYKTQTAGMIDSKVSNSNYTSDMKQMAGQIEDKVSNGTFTSYKTETANLIGSKVSNGDFTTYKTQTAGLISAKVETKDFSAYQATTAKSIDSKVESKDFNTYKTQTADAISSKVSSTDFNNLTISNRNLALGTATAIKATGSNQDNQLINGYRLSKTIPQGTVVTVTFDVSSTTGVGEFIMQFNGDDSGSSWQTVSTDNLIKGTKNVSATITTDTNHLGFFPRLNNATGDVTVSNFIISESSKEVNWSPAPEDMASQSQITQLSGQIDLSVKKGDLLSQINMQAGNTLISASKQLTLSSKSVFLDSDDPVIMKSANIDTLLVGKKLTAADIAANTFTTNNGTFTVKQDGSVTAKSMTLIGGTLSSPTINTSTINGSTINGTTFNGGDRINNANNTAGYYPMTITSDGTYKSTYFDSAVGLQSSVESGAISYKYRSMIGNGQYSAYDSVINGQGFQSQSGYTSDKDTTFSSPETITGYVNVTPATGIYLYGPTQQINFAGRSDNIGSNGITMDAYGNIYGQSNSSWWRIGDVNGNQIINFGIDKAGSNHIEFKRDIEIGNIGINMAHSIISQDGKGLYINSGKGGRADLNVASLNYTGSVSKSLLSEKKDVKKTDTAYWAQLVNSIDLATYQYKDDDNTSNLRLSGIVDDVNEDKQWNLPDIFVARDENGKLAGIENVVLQNAMLATIQEQQKEIDKLNGHLLKLEAKLNG